MFSLKKEKASALQVAVDPLLYCARFFLSAFVLFLWNFMQINFM